jgi:hypothetical protein
MSASVKRFTPSLPDPRHAPFLALPPTIETHAQIVFRGCKCPVRGEKAVQECVALAWQWYTRLVARGKDVTCFPMAFTILVVRAVKSGRRLCDQERTQDVLSPLPQQRHGFVVESLPVAHRASHEQLYATPHAQQQQDLYEDRLCDNTVTPSPDQAAFGIDFPAWLRTLTARERRLIRTRARNERTKELSRQFALSPARISQLRQEFRQGWQRFCGEEEGAQAMAREYARKDQGEHTGGGTQALTGRRTLPGLLSHAPAWPAEMQAFSLAVDARTALGQLAKVWVGSGCSFVASCVHLPLFLENRCIGRTCRDMLFHAGPLVRAPGLRPCSRLRNGDGGPPGEVPSGPVSPHLHAERPP